jgi:hypothetical protein
MRKAIYLREPIPSRETRHLRFNIFAAVRQRHPAPADPIDFGLSPVKSIRERISGRWKTRGRERARSPRRGGHLAAQQ